MSKPKTILSILQQLDQGKYLGIGGSDGALADIEALILEVIGEDNSTKDNTGWHLNKNVGEYWNDLRSKQRTRLKQLIGGK